MPVNLEQRLDRLTPDQRVLLKRRLTQDARQRSEEFSGDTDSRLVAYVVANPGVEPPASEDLRRFLSQRLPSHMIPSRFTTLDALPFLPNGKIDRAALAGRREARPTRDAQHATTSKIERQLMLIWSDLLDVLEIGRDDNFFELGGHSLLLPRLVDRIQRDFGFALPLGTVFQAPTVRALAEIIHSSSPTQAWRSLVGIRETGRRPPLYLVHGLGGEIGYFYNLAGYLNPDQPVFGLQAPMEPFSQLEAMAAQYLAEVRRHPAAWSISARRVLCRRVCGLRDGPATNRSRRICSAARDHRCGDTQSAAGDTSAWSAHQTVGSKASARDRAGPEA